MQQTFVGRAEELETYQEFLKTDWPWMLVITGIGGIGKSRLLQHFGDQTPSSIVVVRLNFDEERLRTDSTSILYEIAKQTAQYCKGETVTAFTNCFEERHEELKTLEKQLEQVYTSVKLRESVPVAVSERAEREIYLQIREQITDALYDQLETFNLSQLVLMFDTYELLNDPWISETSQWLLNEYLPELRRYLQKQGCRCSTVIASRVVPQFETLYAKDIYYISLSMLREDGVRDYLVAQGMYDAALQRRVYELTKGHALLLTIMVTLWKEQGEQPLTAATSFTLEKKFNEKAAMEFVRERLYEYLETPFKELTRYGALLRSFDLPLLQAVFPELLAEPEVYEQFRRFIRYSYITPLGNYRYVFHELIRSVQCEYVRDNEDEHKKWILYHVRARNFLLIHAPYSPDYYYHALAADDTQKEAMAEWLKAIQDALNLSMRERVEALLQVVEDKTLKLTPLSQARRALQKGNFYYYYGDKQLSDALSCYKEALTLYQIAGNRLGEADVFQLIGRLEQFRKNTNEASKYYQKALELYEEVKDVRSQANAHKSIGDVQMFREDIDKTHSSLDIAQSSYEQALSLYEKVNELLGRANVYKAMGDIQQLRKNAGKALEHYNIALVLYKKVGDRLGEANALQAMGETIQSSNVVRFDDELNESLSKHAQALQIYREVQDRLGEANAFKAIGMVHFLRKDDIQAAFVSFQEALRLYQEVEDSLGEANVSKAIGDVLQFRDELPEAWLYYRLALTFYSQIGNRLGEADVLQAMGKVLQCNDEPMQALQYYEKALILYLELENRLGQADVQLVIGDVLQSHQNLVEAMKHYKQALLLYQETGFSLGEANCYMAEGRVAAEQEKYKDALALYNYAYIFYKVLQDEYSQARLLFYRSYLYEWIPDIPKALQDAKASFEIAQRLALPFVDLFQHHFDFLRRYTSYL